jgi:hypothetical protein
MATKVKTFAQKNREMGLCGCGQSPIAGKKMCEKCTVYFRDANKEARKKRVAKGNCLSCSVRKIATGHRCCKICMDRFKELYAANVERGACGACGKGEIIAGKKRCQRCLDNSATAKQRQKQQVLDHYGQMCIWPNCNVTDYDLLTVDHINNDGKEERKKFKNHSWKRAIDSRFSAVYQILCWNHQWKKRMMTLRNEILPAMSRKAGVGA